MLAGVWDLGLGLRAVGTERPWGLRPGAWCFWVVQALRTNLGALNIQNRVLLYILL